MHCLKWRTSTTDIGRRLNDLLLRMSGNSRKCVRFLGLVFAWLSGFLIFSLLIIVLTNSFNQSPSCEGGYASRAFHFYQTQGAVSGGAYDSNEGCKPYGFPETNSPMVEGEVRSGSCLTECANGEEYYASEFFTRCVCLVSVVDSYFLRLEIS
jgi:hypothetical protein